MVVLTYKMYLIFCTDAETDESKESSEESTGQEETVIDEKVQVERKCVADESVWWRVCLKRKSV